MAGVQNILADQKGKAHPEFICLYTIVLMRHSIVHPNHVVNGHRPHFNSDSTLGTSHGRLNQHGAGHLNNCLDFTFRNTVLISSTSSAKANVLVLFN